MSDKIVLGSGYLYVTEFTGGTIPADNVIEVDANRLGYIKGGATLTYTPTWYKAIDDMGRVSKSIKTNEVATLKSGIMTWDGETLKKLVSNARLTTQAATSSAAGKRTLKIGGGSDDGKMYLIRFLHPDAADGDMRVTVIGKNQAGFEIAFAKESETVIDAEFTAFPADSDGTLIQIDETIPQLST